MKYIIFDLDGVILSEERCFDASAVAMWALFSSDKYLQVDHKEYALPLTIETVHSMRAYYCHNDEILAWLKAKGINSNVDMVHAYVLGGLGFLAAQKAYDGKLEKFDGEALATLGAYYQDYEVKPLDVLNWLKNNTKANSKKYEFFAELVALIAKAYEVPAEQLVINGELFSVADKVFGSWYEAIEKLYPGEELLAPKDKLIELFEDLQAKGFTLCIGTGRPMQDVNIPLQQLGIFRYFAKNHVATYDDALMAAILSGSESLNKPNPFIFRAAWWGTQPERYEKYVKNPSFFEQEHSQDEVYVIGDSVADIQAAKKMGVPIFATLTGLSGEEDEKILKEAGATAVIKGVLDLKWHI